MSDKIKVNDYTCNYEVIGSSNGWRIIRTSCACLSEDHTLDVEVERDKDFGTTLIFNYELPSKDILLINSSHEDNPIKRFALRNWEKVKFIGKIIFNRPITFEEAFIFRGKQHVYDVADYLKKAADEVDEEE